MKEVNCKNCPINRCDSINCINELNYYTSDPNKSWSSSNDEGTKTPWILLGIIRYGEVTTGVPSNFRQTYSYQDGLRAYFNRETGEYCTKVIKDFFKDISHTPEGKEHHDYCGYCGADNGEFGELRQGWDCYMCGSN